MKSISNVKSNSYKLVSGLWVVPIDVNGIGSIRTRVFVAGHVSCFQMRPYSLWTSLTGVVGSGNNKMNGTLKPQCSLMKDMVVDQLWCGVVSL